MQKYSIPQLTPITDSSNTLKQYLSEQPFYSNFAIPRVSQQTPTGRSQADFSAQLNTAFFSTQLSLPANTGPQDCTAQQSLFVSSPDPTALGVQQTALTELSLAMSSSLAKSNSTLVRSKLCNQRNVNVSALLITSHYNGIE
jgi:hypothetical protein